MIITDKKDNIVSEIGQTQNIAKIQLNVNLIFLHCKRLNVVKLIKSLKSLDSRGSIGNKHNNRMHTKKKKYMYSHVL